MKYDGSIRINTEINSKNASAQLMSLENRIVKTADKIAGLRSKMDALRDVKIPTQSYKDIESDITKAERELQRLIEKQAQMQNEGKDSGAAWDRLNQRIQAAKDYIETARDEMQQLIDTGKAFTLGKSTEQYANLGRQLQYAENEMSVLNQWHDELIAKQNKNADGYKRIGKAARDGGKVANKAVKGMSDSLKFGLKNILKYGLGIRSLYVLVNKIRAGIKEGFSNLYNDKNMTSFKNKADGLKASLLTLKNSFASAFRPLIDVAIPYIQKVSDAMSNLLNKVGQFMAAITGQKTYTKAIKQTVAAIQDETKAQNKQLSSLDKLNNLSNEKEEKVSIGMFEEEVPISDKVLEGLTPEGIAGAIGDWVNNALDTMIEFIEKTDWGKVGKTIGKFLKNLDFLETGRKVGKLIWKAINAGIKFFKGIFDTAPIEAVILAAISVMTLTGLGTIVSDMIKRHLNGLTIAGIALVLDGFATTVTEVGDIKTQAINALETGLGTFMITKDLKLSFLISGITFAIGFATKAGNWLGKKLLKSVLEANGQDTSGIDEMEEVSVIQSLEFLWDVQFGNGIDEEKKIKMKEWLENWAIENGFEIAIPFIEANILGDWTEMKKLLDEVGESLKNLMIISPKSAEGLKSAFNNIGSWFGKKFGEAKTNAKNTFEYISTRAKTTRENINTVFQNIGSWFGNKFTNAYANIKSAFSGTKTFFSEVWSNIKCAFGNISGWFKDKFSAAWQAVKDVFSSGGKVFSGIKDGILTGLKSVVNLLIDGINKVVKIPFDGLNSALSSLKSFSIAGAKPFSFLPTISVPQIPRLATGTVVPPNNEFLAVLGDNKREPEIVSPISTIEQAVINAMQKSGNFGSTDLTIRIPVEIDGRTLFELIKKFDLDQYRRTGRPSFQM